MDGHNLKNTISIFLEEWNWGESFGGLVDQIREIKQKLLQSQKEAPIESENECNIWLHT